jgi:integrase
VSVYRPARSRFFHYDFVCKGRRYHGSTEVESRRLAEQVERNLRNRIALGADPHAEMTLDQAAGRWWEEVGRHLRTAADLERRLETLLRLMGPATPLAEISTAKVSAAIEIRRGETFARSAAPGARRYRLSNATVNADVPDLLRRILMRARDVWEVGGLRAIAWRKLRLKEPEAQVCYYTAAQRQAWLDACDDATRLQLQLLLTYGLRLQELFVPPQAYDPGGEDHGPRLAINKRKRGSHLLPLREDDARQIAARAGRAIAAGLPHLWFEADAKGQLVAMSYYGIQTRLRTAARRAGITTPRVIHGARHHAGTMAVSATGSLKLAQQLLGHVSISSTMRYAHALDRDLRELLEGLSRPGPGPAQAEGEYVPPKQRRRR